ncbi:hypothetical protein EC973_005360 [Apophysomyces ossiformis]|uniref:Geranylgeranyl transferase type-2 subunit alpha n=1 Tax=Apophysomyces ossiformis TaxID=679940 RepID=A0A8H7EL38_9FUNG|nr:hypothetical protein EC973_005360 [Apophysomyces ossiformis]
MSDVHGVKRVRTTEEATKARREREAGKIKEYNNIVAECREKVQAQEFSNETLGMTTRILSTNPDYYTVWNWRRLILIEGILKTADEKRSVFVKELQLFMQLIHLNPKSYWLWNHRCWCLRTMPEPDWTGELRLVDKMLGMDARNFHGWDYRRYVVRQLRALSESTEDDLRIVEQEYAFTTQKIEQNFSNYSAWHQRSKLLPEIVANKSTEERNEVAKKELDIIKSAIYTEPDDQSAWLYYWWLLGKGRFYTTEFVSLLGAFCIEESALVVIGFNDDITLTKAPTVIDANDQPVLGQWMSLSARDKGAVWIFAPSGKKLLRYLVGQCLITGILERMKSYEERFNDISNVWKPLKHQRYADPSASGSQTWYTLDPIQLLKDEIQAVRDLLDIEPESKWALQTLAHFLQQLKLRLNGKHADNLDEQIVDIFDKLCALDTSRRCRYEDGSECFAQKEKSEATGINIKNVEARILFERSTRSLLQEDGHGEQVLVPTRLESLDLSQCPVINPALLLLVRRLSMQPSETTMLILDQLPFLEECTQVL